MGVGGFHELCCGRVEIEGSLGLSGGEGFDAAKADEGEDAEVDGREAGEKVDELNVGAVLSVGAAGGDEEAGPDFANPVFIDP